MMCYCLTIGRARGKRAGREDEGEEEEGEEEGGDGGGDGGEDGGGGQPMLEQQGKELGEGTETENLNRRSCDVITSVVIIDGVTLSKTASTDV